MISNCEQGQGRIQVSNEKPMQLTKNTSEPPKTQTSFFFGHTQRIDLVLLKKVPF